MKNYLIPEMTIDSFVEVCEELAPIRKSLTVGEPLTKDQDRQLWFLLTEVVVNTAAMNVLKQKQDTKWYARFMFWRK